jgi:hypothetical protein
MRKVNRADQPKEENRMLKISLGRLNLHEEETNNFVWEEEAYDPTEKAWNFAKEVVWWRIDDNLFTIEFDCLGDWDKAMNREPWLFRKNYALMMEEYDGFQKPRSIVLDKITISARVMKLPTVT